MSALDSEPQRDATTAMNKISRRGYPVSSSWVVDAVNELQGIIGGMLDFRLAILPVFHHKTLRGANMESLENRRKKTMSNLMR
jgi:hypothetical protein